MNKNIVLIGMPSSGKSTVGELLAKELDMSFIDTDRVIREKENRDLKDIVNTDGLKRFLEIQEQAILELRLQGYVIATGGGVVYGDVSMNHLKVNGTVVFLKQEYEEIEQRVTSDRRFARDESQSLKDLFIERMPLYKKYADVTVDCLDKSVEVIVEEIKGIMNQQ